MYRDKNVYWEMWSRSIDKPKVNIYKLFDLTIIYNAIEVFVLNLLSRKIDIV